MARKSMGNFIAILRKAKGMTQVDLAEKLNVSDKTVSRWERGEGAPDLMLVPVIGDIFGVTSDELLRGERIHTSNDSLDESQERGKINPKHLKRLLGINLLKLTNQNLIFIGIMLIGFIGAMTCNFVFNRGYLGYFIASFFYVIGVVYEVIIINTAFSKVSGPEFEGDEIDNFKRTVLTIIKRIVYFSVILFAITLPLVLVKEPLFGISGGSWIKLGLLYGAIALGLCLIISNIIDFILIRKRVYILENKEYETYKFNLNLKKKYGLILIGILIITLIGHWVINEKYMPYNKDSFINHFIVDNGAMETTEDIIEYFDKDGNPISEEEALSGSSHDISSGISYSYAKRQGNSNTHIVYNDKYGFFPIIIYTYKAYNFGGIPWGKIIMIIPNLSFFLIYLMEVLAIMTLYYKKRTS